MTIHVGFSRFSPIKGDPVREESQGRATEGPRIFKAGCLARGPWSRTARLRGTPSSRRRVRRVSPGTGTPGGPGARRRARAGPHFRAVAGGGCRPRDREGRTPPRSHPGQIKEAQVSGMVGQGDMPRPELGKWGPKGKKIKRGERQAGSTKLTVLAKPEGRSYDFVPRRPWCGNGGPKPVDKAQPLDAGEARGKRAAKKQLQKRHRPGTARL